MLFDVSPFFSRRIKIVKVVNACDRPTVFRKQTVNQMRADKTGAAGNENVSFCHIIESLIYLDLVS
jgi:hypothetical protein